MLSIFAIPKPFRGHIDVIQRNAIQSWLQLSPRCEIILCGNDDGVSDVASEYGLRHLPHIEHSPLGTPLLGSAFKEVERVARYTLLAYTNADIIFLSDLTACVRRVKMKRFLLTGQRWNLDLAKRIDFERENWEQRLRQKTELEGVLFSPKAFDYFVFPKGMLGKVPNFVVGRPKWDSWFVYRARSRGLAVIDATRVNMVIHQNHDYTHVPERVTGKRWEGPEGDHNIRLVGGRDHVFTLLDATHFLTPRLLLPAWDVAHLQRRWRTLPILKPKTKFFVRVVNGLISRARRLAQWIKSHLGNQGVVE